MRNIMFLIIGFIILIVGLLIQARKNRNGDDERSKYIENKSFIFSYWSIIVSVILFINIRSWFASSKDLLLSYYEIGFFVLLIMVHYQTIFHTFITVKNYRN